MFLPESYQVTLFLMVLSMLCWGSWANTLKLCPRFRFQLFYWDYAIGLAAGAVAVSAFGVLNAQFLSGPRLTWAMARDGLFFTPFGRLNRRFLTPAPAILLLGVLATVLTLGLGLARTDLLTTGVVVVDAVFFALTGLALPILRRRGVGSDRGAAWIAWVAVIFAALELLAIAGSLLQQNVRLVALTGLGWVAAGIVIWALIFARRVK